MNLGKKWKNAALVAMLLIPFLLYWAVVSGHSGLVYVLLALMGLIMVLTLKVG